MISLISLGVSLLIGLSAGYLGSLMVSKKMSLAGGPLGHLALPGIAVALILGINIFWGALLSVTLGAVLIWILERRSNLPLEALTGIVFATGVALGFLILPLSRAEEAVVGDISQVNRVDLVIGLIIATSTLILISRLYPKITLISISKELARNKGIRISGISLLYLLAIAMVTAFEVKVIGILLTAAMFILPSSAAREISSNLKQYKFFSVLFGVVSTSSGYLVSASTGWPAGPLMILSASFLFLASLLLTRRE